MAYGRPRRIFGAVSMRRVRARRVANAASRSARSRGLFSGVRRLPRELQQQVFETYHRGLTQRGNDSRAGRTTQPRTGHSRGAVAYSRVRARRLVN